MKRWQLLVLSLTLAWSPSAAPSAGAEPPGPDIDGYTKHVAPFFKQHCLKCHGPIKPEGGLSLGKLNTDLTANEDLGKWQKILTRLQRGDMPPEDEPRPPSAAVAPVAQWVRGELRKADPALLAKEAPQKPRYFPGDGNRVPHEALFGFEAKPGGASPPRLWRLSPQAYTDLTQVLMGKSAKSPLSQPFSSLTENGFKDYAAAFAADEPTTMQLYRNAKEIVARQTDLSSKGGGKNGLNKVYLPLFDAQTPPNRAALEAAVRAQFNVALKREPAKDELERFTALLEKNRREAGADGIRATLAAILIQPEAIFRSELGAGPVDEHGRQLLAPRELAYALGYALSDKGPDKLLLDAAAAGKLNSRAEAAHHVQRLLNDAAFDKPRVLRFFQEYFGYPLAVEVFKEKKSYPDHDAKALIADTDRLIQYILAQDKNVLAELLTTDKSFVAYSKDAKSKGKGARAFTTYGFDNSPAEQPVSLAAGQRAGVLTQPSWLVAYSTSFDNHAILRGKWVRERLLGGTVPDLPITVDAKLPNDPHQTLRQRMEVTRAAYCWQCHQKMNDLGLAFESFDHFGRYRTTELDKPVDTAGKVAKSGDPNLDGEVADAVALVKKLAASERVEQVFVRHAFRYWLGRNETPTDAYTLQEAQRAYRSSGGSMKALLASLLTSEAFLYRKSSR